MNTPNSGTDEARDLRMERRRMEAEVFILQADRSRYARQEEEKAAEIRMTEKALGDKERELQEKQIERVALSRKVQEIDNEILRLKRSTYKNH